MRKILAGGFVVALLLVIGLWLAGGSRLAMRLAGDLMLGQPAEMVVLKFGSPTHELSAEEANRRGVDAPGKSMRYRPIPERKATGKVLLYGDGEHATYVFVDAKGVVEAVDQASRQ